MKSGLESLLLLDNLVVRLDVTKTLLRVCLGVWVETEQNLLVLEWVLLLDNSALADGTALDWSEHRLHFGAVDELGNVWLGDHVAWEEEVLLELGWSCGAAVDSVEGRESGGGPDDEAAEVTTWCELEEVQCVDGAGLDTGDVAESSDNVLAVLLWLVDDERTAALLVAAVPELALSCAELAGVLDLLDIGIGTDSLEETDSGGGLLDGTTGESGGGNDEWDLWDGGDVVATGEKEGGARGGGDGRGSRETLLAKVDLLVPLAPDLGGCEHATRTAHVTVCSLTGTVSTTTGHTWDTCDGAT